MVAILLWGNELPGESYLQWDGVQCDIPSISQRLLQRLLDLLQLCGIVLQETTIFAELNFTDDFWAIKNGEIGFIVIAWLTASEPINSSYIIDCLGLC